jgi:hypothetical protein
MFFSNAGKLLSDYMTEHIPEARSLNENKVMVLKLSEMKQNEACQSSV